MQNLTPAKDHFMWQELSTFWLMDLWLRNHLRLTSCSDEIPSPTAWCQECCCYCSASEHVPQGMTDECYWAERQKADETLVCWNRDWNRAPAVTVQGHILDKKKVYLHCCSKQGHPGVRGDDGGDSFLWAVILGDYRDSQVITKYPSTLHLPWTIQSQMSVLIPKSHGFTAEENCSTAFLEDTSAVTYQWRKKCTGQ